MGELLGALGLAWPRLLLYPGGLFALGASWLLWRWLAWCAGRPLTTPPGAGVPTLLDLGDLVPPLAILSLLPLAPAREFPFGVDLVVAVGLLEWPRLRRWGASTALEPAAGRAALLRTYGPLVLAGALLAASADGLGLSGLLSWPTDWPRRALMLGGACLWLAALPQLLAAGPAGLAGRLRALGLVLVGALPLIGALAAMTRGAGPGALAGWVLPPAAGVIAALAVGTLVRAQRAFE